MNAVITHKFSPLTNFDADGHKAPLDCESISHSNSILVLDSNCNGSALFIEVQLCEQKIAVLEGGLV